MISKIVGETPNSHNQQKRFRDAEVGGSNPLSPTLFNSLPKQEFLLSAGVRQCGVSRRRKTVSTELRRDRLIALWLQCDRLFLPDMRRFDHCRRTLHLLSSLRHRQLWHGWPLHACDSFHSVPAQQVRGRIACRFRPISPK